MELDISEREKLEKVLFNPLVDYKLQITPNIKKIVMKISDTSLGEAAIMPLIRNSEHDKFISYEDRDTLNYSKLVANAKNRDIILKLRPTAHKLFLWILYSLQYRTDVITIKPDMVKRFISEKGLREAILQLEGEKIIKRIGKKKELDFMDFHINPQFFFRGDAKGFYVDLLQVHPEYINLQSIQTPKKLTKKGL
jgi:hypothetical protein